MEIIHPRKYVSYHNGNLSSPVATGIIITTTSGAASDSKF